MDHEAFQWLILVVRYALVVVPSLVTVPDRTEEEFLTATALIQVCTCISVQVTHKLLDDDIIGKSLLVEVLAPSVYRILVVASVESLLCLIQVVGDIIVLSLVVVIILGVLVCELDTLAGVMITLVERESAAVSR